MSSMGELTFFFGLQVKQKKDGIFISQDKYVAEILKKFNFVSVKTASTPIETQKPLVKDEEASDVDVHLYRSMIGSLMYLTADKYGYIKNHKKTVKNGQTRTRGTEEHKRSQSMQEPEAKVKKSTLVNFQSNLGQSHKSKTQMLPK
ncbi:uncharacterized mitochondrial protein-like protein [Tanacetum coccineum]